MVESMFTDQEYAELLAQIESNPEIDWDPNAIRAKMTEFDAHIRALELEKPGEYKTAIIILLQGRNFLARYLDEPEIPKSRFDEQEEAPWSPLDDKHVAVYVAEPKTSPFYKAVAQVLWLYDELRYKLYACVSDLLSAVLEGRVAGVVAFQNSHRACVEDHLRHDLKNQPDWNYGAAQVYPMPPCKDFPVSCMLPKVMEVMILMQKGEYQQERPEDMTAVRPSELVPFMWIPPKPIQVVIVDDHEEEVKGMLEILYAWPQISVQFILQEGQQDPVIPLDTDIVLLDEVMCCGVTGTGIANRLRTKGFTGIIASTTGGDQPPGFTKLHFSGKTWMHKLQNYAREFCILMSQILRKLH